MFLEVAAMEVHHDKGTRLPALSMCPISSLTVARRSVVRCSRYLRWVPFLAHAR
jgi:hypothetical protein